MKRRRDRRFGPRDGLVHPDSPSGGCGPGSSRLPGPLDTAQSGAPHPDAPAARSGSWWAECAAKFGARETTSAELTSSRAEIDYAFEVASDRFRRALPDAWLQALYRAYGSAVTVKYRRPDGPFGAPTHESVLERLYASVWWVDPDHFAARLRTQAVAASDVLSGHVSVSCGLIGNRVRRSEIDTRDAVDRGGEGQRAGREAIHFRMEHRLDHSETCGHR